MSKSPNTPDSDMVEPIDLRTALEERYLAYALSTIMHRALPDARDGLKPVHRRLLFAMRQLKLNPEAGFKKCARVVGDVIGKYHPHGDQAVYEALVRLAQSFAVRYPLVDGQGNFGNVDGDNAAAMRYTEARLTDVAKALLDGLDEDAVDFRDTYDGEDNEPIVLPANFPNLLANGTSGIAVGMATNVPPHNVAELCDAALYLIKHPNAPTSKLVEFVPGPDFPTGGVIVEPAAQILEAYETGRGGFRLRARWRTEAGGRGTYVIIVDEIPYGVQKSRLIEKIAELLTSRKLPLLADIRDESDEQIRVVLEPKSRSTDPDLLMESLFKLTDLEQRISLNMNLLSRGRVPMVMGLGSALREWLDHRLVVLKRRSEFRLDKIAHRLEVLDGYLIAYLNLDEIIAIIRYEDEPKARLIERFSLSDVQAEAILNMRLRALRKLEEVEIRKEHDLLTGEQTILTALLASEHAQWTRIGAEIRETRARFGPDSPIGRRRSDFAKAPAMDIDLTQAMIEKEPITVILSEKGWIRAMRGHVSDTSNIQYKSGDGPRFIVHAQTTDKIILFVTNGKFYTLNADKLPGGRGNGEPVRLMIDLDDNQDFVSCFVYEGGREFLLVATDARGFIVAEDELVATTRKGKQILNVASGCEALLCTPAEGDYIASIGENRKLLLFSRSELPQMSRGRGVLLQRLRDGALSDAKCFNWPDGLSWTDSSQRQWKVKPQDLAEWNGNRAQAGRAPPRGFPRSNKFSG